MSPFALGLSGIGVMFALLLLRQPVWLALALCGIIGNALLNSVSMSLFVTGTGTFDTASSYGLSVIPLFILMGEVASGSRMSRDLFEAARVVLSGMRGGLAVASIAASGAFGAICGSSVATAASMTRIALPEMRRAGYEDGYAASSVAAGGSLGILIPPSIILVIYGSIAEASVARLFAASMIPGIVLLLLYIVVAWVLAGTNGDTGTATRYTLVQRLRALIAPWHFLILFIATIGGIYVGVFSPNEAASIGAFGAIVIGFVRRTLTWQGFIDAVKASVLISCGLFMIIIGAKLFATFVVQTRLPDTLLNLALSAELSPVLIMLLIVILYIVMGCFLEGIGMVLITVPVFLPVIEGYGFDPIWFGVLVAVLVELGLITPPVGMNLFIIKAQADDLSMGRLYRSIAPFLLAPAILMALLFAMPQIALWLPGVLF
ncbi:C4-dicarboxylate ABC transporter permease (plasmid) [Pacificitalea manganoxidans]|uniref:TRAP transporter large permease protein n=1 Tax=Pacificitalea manganoxidans TaxID=1411902 RepID=A0A291M527_9RHOB|nr:TRAP transporter large permease [Pacificitalea manganoxidans]ATI43918.1 C4-dicarboxylate ABC transporter permease [Pacificitalea manganoxidans]MDR6310273.1 tripartite ATP-independent transporter DctM subunit [Pacificitalea manganoxidans]